MHAKKTKKPLRYCEGLFPGNRRTGRVQRLHECRAAFRRCQARLHSPCLLWPSISLVGSIRLHSPRSPGFPVDTASPCDRRHGLTKPLIDHGLPRRQAEARPIVECREAAACQRNAAPIAASPPTSSAIRLTRCNVPYLAAFVPYTPLRESLLSPRPFSR